MRTLFMTLAVFLIWTSTSFVARAADTVDGTVLVTDERALTPPSISRPVYLVPMIDRVFGTTIIRVTDPRKPIPNPHGALTLVGKSWDDRPRHHYSMTNDAWNADGSLLMLDRGASRNVYLDGETYKPLFYRGRPGPNRWHPVDPSLQVYMRGNELGYWNPRTNQKSEVVKVRGYSSFKFGPSQGNPSDDGRCVAVHAKRSDGVWVFFAYDIPAKKKYPDVPYRKYTRLNSDGTPKADFVTISPLCNYLYLNAHVGDISGGDRTLILDLNGNRVGPVWSNYGEPSHADFTVDENGDEVAIGPAKSGAHKGYIIKRRFKDGKITSLLKAWGTHASTRNLGRPGWVYVSFAKPGNATWIKREVIAIRTDGSGEFQRLAHMHSPRDRYVAEAHANPSPDGTKIVFASNWDKSDGGAVAAYVIELPMVAAIEPPEPPTPPEPPESEICAVELKVAGISVYCE